MSTDADGFCMVCESGGSGCDACRPGIGLAKHHLTCTLATLDGLTPDLLTVFRATPEAAELRALLVTTPRPETATGGPCFICAREALAGFQFKGKPVCLSCAPNSLAGEVTLEFTDTENAAIEAGGADAGAYLDAIGKTDLATLEPEQWTRFLGCFLAGYSAHMRAAAAANPPF